MNGDPQEVGCGLPLGRSGVALPSWERSEHVRVKSRAGHEEGSATTDTSSAPASGFSVRRLWPHSSSDAARDDRRNIGRRESTSLP